MSLNVSLNIPRAPLLLVLTDLFIGGLALVFIYHATIASANSVPSIDSLTTSTTSFGADATEINLLESPSTRTLYIHGTASDPDGCADINAANQWSIKAHRTNHTNGSSCSADNNDCYVASIALSGCDGPEDLTLVYQGTVALQHYADPTDAGSPQSGTNWTAYARVEDTVQANHSLADAFEVNSLLALNVTTTIDYGTVQLDAISPQQTLTFTNTGNRALDADQSAGGAMICNAAGSQSIAVSATHLSLTDGFTYGTGDQALATNPTVVDLSLALRTNDAAPLSKDVYLKLKMPLNGVRGACENTLTFTAKVDA